MTIESRFVTREYADEQFPDAIRLFFRTVDVDAYNSASTSGENVVHHVTFDIYAGCADATKRASAMAKVHKMKANETGGLPYMLNLLVGKPYQIRTNIDVIDGLVNGAIGILCYIERDDDACVKQLWLSFDRPKTGRLIRAKCDAHLRSHPHLQQGWVPISERTANIQLKGNIWTCKCKQFPLCEACAITIHKSQGGTYDTVICEYDKGHNQQLVYVAMSRATSLLGLHLTNRDKDHRFHHARGRVNRDLRDEFACLKRHLFKTIGNSAREFLARADVHPTALSLCTLNTQSLKAHREDISTDSVLPKVKLLSLTET